ncbi:putative quinol monooxygenase [Lentilitoribacter sp. EG35]|uniref:putative quinol monooxygenase n=1 Tax=Lentilitoribacter sp. EG35 TaxID=3234192 RepID=UPI00345F6DDD
MILVTVEAKFSPDDVDEAISLFNAQADDIRLMDGCGHYALFRDIGGDGIAILQHWAATDAFNAYKTSDVFAKLGQDLRPLMTAFPVTRVATIDSV